MRILKTLLVLWMIPSLLLGDAPKHVDIFILTHENFKGEMATVRGIGGDVEQNLQKVGWLTTKVEVLSKGATPFPLSPDLIHQLQTTSNPSLIIMAGASGASFAKQLNASHNPNLILIESSHQLESFHSEIAKEVDVLSIPAHVLSAAAIGRLNGHRATIVPTRGVAHTTTKETLKAAYEKNKTVLPDARLPIVFILGGDAPDSEGKMHFYTKKDVDAQLYALTAFLSDKKDFTVLLFNGFRTGRHDPTSDPKAPKVSTPEPHKKFMDKDGVERYASDAITTHAIAEIQSRYGDLHLGKNCFVFDFHDGEPSLLEAAEGLVVEKGGYIIVPGESTSMITQALDAAAPSLPKGHVFTYTHSAMNPGHLAYLKNDKRILALKLDGKRKSMHDPKVGLVAPNETAAATIAKAALECMDKKKTH